MRAGVAVASVVVSVAAGVTLGTVSASAAPRVYANCAALNVAYPFGVARWGGRDRSSGVPAAGFAIDDAAYAANRRLDADGDGVACERQGGSPVRRPSAGPTSTTTAAPAPSSSGDHDPDVT